MTGSLDADAHSPTGPLAEAPTAPLREGRTRNRRLRWAVIAAALVGAAVVLLGLLWVREVESGPTDAARTWVEDLAGGSSERALRSSCAEGVRRHPTGESLREEFEAFVGGRVDTARAGEQTLVRGPYGSAVYVPFSAVLVDGSSSRFEIKVVREDAAWLVCGFR